MAAGGGGQRMYRPGNYRRSPETDWNPPGGFLGGRIYFATPEQIAARLSRFASTFWSALQACLSYKPPPKMSARRLGPCHPPLSGPCRRNHSETGLRTSPLERCKSLRPHFFARSMFCLATLDAPPPARLRPCRMLPERFIVSKNNRWL